MKNLFQYFVCFCLVALLCISTYDHRIKSVEPVVIAEPQFIYSCKDSLQNVKLKKKVKGLTYQRDSLAMEHIRKDGLLKDSSSFIITRPATKTKYEQLKEEHNKGWERQCII